jgi:ribulose-5-phosphate 4-epimerase/fuculose-1-phosphate aldolase
MTESELRDQMVAFGLSLFSRGLTAGSSGNLSVRLKDGFLITPTNSSLGALDPAHIAKIGREGELLSGDRPSKELFLHLAMYEKRPDDHAIVHLHSTYSSAVSCLSHLDSANCIPPLTAYYVMKIGRLPLVPYFRPGDPDLAQEVRSLAATHHAILLANHGPIVSGPSLESAVYSIEELEETAKIFLLIHDRPASLLSGAQIDELKRVFALRF